MNEISFNTTKTEDDIILKIVKRALAELDQVTDQISLMMDLSATHCNGTPLDFEKLLAFDKFNFAHDVYGIMSHLDRTDGKIKRGFLPRCSK